MDEKLRPVTRGRSYPKLGKEDEYMFSGMKDWTNEKHRKLMVEYLLQHLMNTKSYERKAELIEEFAQKLVDYNFAPDKTDGW